MTVVSAVLQGFLQWAILYQRLRILRVQCNSGYAGAGWGSGSDVIQAWQGTCKPDRGYIECGVRVRMHHEIKGECMPVEKAVFGSEDRVIIDREQLHSGFLGVARYTLKHRLYQGGWSNAFTREVLERAPGVGVLLYDPDLDKVVLVEQFRAGCLDNPEGPWVLELVAGIVDTDESLEQVACREAHEEAGLTLSDLIPVCTYYNSPGGSSEKLTVLCGRVDANAAGGYFGLPEENEDIKTVVMGREAALQAVNDGRINNAMAILALQWLALNLDTVKAEMNKARQTDGSPGSEK